MRKKDIIWPILVYETDINRCDDDFLNQFDIGVYDEVVRLYSSIIDSCCERIEFFTKILYDYTQFFSSKKQMENAKSLLIVAGRITNQNLLLVALMKKHWKRLQRSFCTM